MRRGVKNKDKKRGDLTVLFEDNHLLALVKPAGMLTQGDRTGDVSLLDLAKQYIKEKYKKPKNVYLGLVHRLDRPAGGIIVFARTSKAARRLSSQFRGRDVKKGYTAVVEGKLDPRSGELSHFLVTSKTKSRVVSHPSPKAQEARLTYAVRDTRGNRSLVEVTLITGRKHQIRAQMAALGCPIVGDIKYGAKTRLGGRIALFATQLVFTHPVSNKTISLSTTLPEDFPWPQEKTRPKG
jgi:23S rRNA pseudouridine1911/1915/1917 synthase